jgi:hypothetical protein
MRGRRAQMWLWPIALYLVSFLALTFPLILRFRTHLFADDGDGLETAWGMWWVDQAVRVLHRSPWWTDYLFHPTGVSLLAHTLHPFNGFVGLGLLRVLTLSQAYNVMLIFAFVVTGLTAFWLCYEVSGAYFGSLVGGFAFTFCNYHFAHAEGHLNLVSLEWLPLFALLWLRFVAAPSVRLGVAAAGALFLVTLCDFYYVVYCVLLGVALAVAESVRARDPFLLLRPGRRAPLLAFLLAVAVSTGPLVGAFLRLSIVDPLEGSHEAQLFSLDLLALVVPGGHWRFALWTRGFWSRLPTGIHESSVHVGISSLVVAGYAWSQRRAFDGARLRRWFAVVALFCLLALGPVLNVAGRTLPVPLPYALLATLLPPLQVSGCAVRLVIVAMLGLAVLWAVGLGQLGRTRRGRLWAAALCALLVVEVLPRPLPATRLPVPPAYQRLMTAPPGALADLVSMPPHQLWLQTLHGRPITGGYVSRTPQSRVASYIHQLDDVKKGRAFELYCEHTIRYLMRRSSEPLLGEPLYADGWMTLTDLGAGRTCELETVRAVLEPARFGEVFRAGWGDLEAGAGGRPFVWSVARRAVVALASRADGDREVRFSAWPFAYPGAPPQTVTLRLNGTPLKTISMSPEKAAYSVIARREVWKKGFNELVFEFGYAESPRDRIAGSNDGRTLSAALDALEIAAPAHYDAGR